MRFFRPESDLKPPACASEVKDRVRYLAFQRNQRSRDDDGNRRYVRRHGDWRKFESKGNGDGNRDDGNQMNQYTCPLSGCLRQGFPLQ